MLHDVRTIPSPIKIMFYGSNCTVIFLVSYIGTGSAVSRPLYPKITCRLVNIHIANHSRNSYTLFGLKSIRYVCRRSWKTYCEELIQHLNSIVMLFFGKATKQLPFTAALLSASSLSASWATASIRYWQKDFGSSAFLFTM